MSWSKRSFLPWVKPLSKNRKRLFFCITVNHLLGGGSKEALAVLKKSPLVIIEMRLDNCITIKPKEKFQWKIYKH